jgi:segregation and condensation protein B
LFGNKRIQRFEAEVEEIASDVSDESYSLEDLGSAYAKSLANTSDEPMDPVAQSVDSSIGSSSDTSDEEQLSPPSVVESDDVPLTPESILEAMLFLGASDNRSLPANRISEILRGTTPEEVAGFVDTLNANYKRHDRAFRVEKEDGGGYRLQLDPKLHLVRDRFYGKIKETQLTQSAIDCLSLVAYQPGIRRVELEKQWNQPAGTMLAMLVRRGLLRVEIGNDGTQPTYFTTERFLEIIGLESLSDLPRSEEI